MIRRREFITILGTAAAWPLAARAQQPNAVKRIGWLSNSRQGFVEQVQKPAFIEELAKLGWKEGVNFRLDLRGSLDSGVEARRRVAAELVAIGPDIILCTGTPATAALQ